MSDDDVWDDQDLPQYVDPELLDISHAHEYEEGTLELFCEESRTVINKQLDQSADIDDKALRTVRIEMLLLGVLASATQFPTARTIVNFWMKAGGVGILISIIFGIAAYSATDDTLGPGPSYIDQVLQVSAGEQVRRVEYLRSCADWIDHNESEIEENATWLEISQYALGIGLVMLFYGVWQIL